MLVFSPSMRTLLKFRFFCRSSESATLASRTRSSFSPYAAEFGAEVSAANSHRFHPKSGTTIQSVLAIAQCEGIRGRARNRSDMRRDEGGQEAQDSVYMPLVDRMDFCPV